MSNLKKIRQKLFSLVIALVIISCTDNSIEIDLHQKPEINDKFQIDTLFTFFFESQYNSEYLTHDLKLECINGRYFGRLPLNVDKTNLAISFSNPNYKVFLDDVELVCGITRIDFSIPHTLKLVSAHDTLFSELNLIDNTLLPTVFVDTDNILVADKENWIKAKLQVLGNKGFENFNCDDIYIKGRGNTTWDAPKKPYSLKFSKKHEMLGMPADDRWVLMANYFDPTMLRAFTGFYLSEKQSNLDYTPRMVFVDLYLNGKYQGVYEFGEHIKIAENRVNVSNNGFILEADAKWIEGEPIFRSPRNIVFNIKDPGFSVTASEFEFITNYISNVENILYSDDFDKNPDLYKEYLDIESFVDWYLINEITKNNDAIFFTSCYMNLKPGEKLKMGPVWDFDLAIGNVDYNNNDVPEGFWVKDAAWINRMFLDPEFVDLVKTRFEHFYNQREVLFTSIRLQAKKLKTGVYVNNKTWGNLLVSSGESSLSLVQLAYKNETEELIHFLETRYDWLNKEFAAM